MNRHAARLVLRLLGIQIAAQIVTFLATSAFAPRVLLLDAATTAASVKTVAVVGVLSVALSILFTLLFTVRLRGALRSLAIGAQDVEPAHVLGLYDMPARLSLAGLGAASAALLATLIPWLRPVAVDVYTQLALVLLGVTMSSTAALPSYITMRASVVRALEFAPPAVTRSALRMLGGRAVGRVRKRFVAAVAAPVTFVALGASLLVDAHARASDREERIADAIDVARAAFEPLGDGDVRGRREAIEAAAAHGFQVQLVPREDARLVVERGDAGETQVTVPVQGAALVRFGGMRLSAVTAIYVLLAVVAVALAGILGTRIGAAFESDVALATREVRHAGVAEVMRGTIILHEARFANVHDLLEAVDALGGVFREFASAQQRAIVAREAAQRMRGLLLASMSHDLKAPLNAVLGFAELVGRSSLTDGQRESLAIIEQRGRELLMLIDTILDSARVEAGELEVSPERTHVGDVVMAAVLEARDLAVGTDVQITGEIQPGVPTLFVDGTRIVQALTQVVMTAARFSDNGVVAVRATLPGEGDRLRIEVETSGEGLPISEREKIFDAFKNAESARRHGALGLGLQLARSIVEIHGGTVEIDTTEGGGLVFRLWLPVGVDVREIRARAGKPSSLGDE